MVGKQPGEKVMYDYEKKKAAIMLIAETLGEMALRELAADIEKMANAKEERNVKSALSSQLNETLADIAKTQV
jgi:hypothetical protein